MSIAFGISYVVFFFLYIFWIAPAKETEHKAHKKAVEIARFFGEKEFHIVNFTTENGGEFVFVGTDNKTNFFPERFDWNYIFKNSRKDQEKYLEIICSLFPFPVSKTDDRRSFCEFKHDVCNGLDRHDL